MSGDESTAGIGSMSERGVVHLLPRGDGARTQCCDRLVLELPIRDRATVSPGLATCPGPQAGAPLIGDSYFDEGDWFDLTDRGLVEALPSGHYEVLEDRRRVVISGTTVEFIDEVRLRWLGPPSA